MHFFNPEDGGTKPLRNVTVYLSTWLHDPEASSIKEIIIVHGMSQIKLLKLAVLRYTMSAGANPATQQQHSIGYLERMCEDTRKGQQK